MSGDPVIRIWKAGPFRWEWHRVSGGNITAHGRTRTRSGAIRSFKKQFPHTRWVETMYPPPT